MLKRVETILFLVAVTVALALPALPLVQELRPADHARQAAATPIVTLERVVVRAPAASSPQQMVLAR